MKEKLDENLNQNLDGSSDELFQMRPATFMSQNILLVTDADGEVLDTTL